MNLIDIVRRAPIPQPWSEGDNIPWSDPAFSRRMLKEHLTQEHDAASRRFAKVDAHVAWIHRELLSERPTQILDLGCGPGLYASRLARLGHACVGIDYSPASIAYARETTDGQGLDCTYVQQDIRTAEVGTGFGLAMLIFGEFNVFRPDDARHILRKAYDALDDGGVLLLEPSTHEHVEREARQGPSWYASPGGLFSDRPHLFLAEHFWDADLGTRTTRYHVVDAATGKVTVHAASYQAYTRPEYTTVLHECGFVDPAFYPSLTGKVDDSQRDFFALAARKQGKRP
jgi:SAM-dependent methyltransferase